METPQEAHPYPDEEAVNTKIYDRARQIDKLLHRDPVENHAAVLGLIQVTAQRRMHEHQTNQGKKLQEAQAQAQARARLAP
jgi:hypothetical protein